MSDDSETKQTEPIQPKKKRGRPSRKQSNKPEVKVEQKTEVLSAEDQDIASLVSEARPYTQAEMKRILIGLEEQGNLYDIVRNTNDLAWPKEIQELEDKKVARYRWIDSKDDTSRIQLQRENFRWTPINRTNHPDLPRRLFNKHGGIMRANLLACYMPWPMYEAWNKIKSAYANEPSRVGEVRHKQKPHKFYDPTKEADGGSISDESAAGMKTPERDGKEAWRSYKTLVHEAHDTHPDDSYTESGETI